MCGLNGILAYHPSASSPDHAELIATRDQMVARGPDGAGEWWNPDRRVALGHRRLSIIDLSERGSQPMASPCGRYVAVYNGEIYNFPDLRRELEADGAQFHSDSDTEALLHLFARHGENMLGKLRGMFAIAIWDEHEKRLFCARDPYGIKPFYYSDDGKIFRFASQVKALMAGGAIAAAPNPSGVVGFHLWGNVPEPHTIYRDIVALPAGHFLWVDREGPRSPQAYFSLAEHLKVSAGAAMSPAEIDARVREAARESVAAHLLADVEVGLFLSAGIDSGSLLGLMRDSGAQKVRAITLAFGEFRGTEEDESVLAAHIAEHYGAKHVVRVVNEAEFRDDLPLILDAMDQPTIDGVNTYFVSKAASEAGLKVALSGTGGDELLAGYPSFAEIPRWVSRMRAMNSVPWMGRIARRLLVSSGLTKKSPKLAGMPEYGGSYPGAYFLKRGLFMPWELEETIGDPEFAERGLRDLAPLALLESGMEPDPGNPTTIVAALESTHYLRNQLLRDVDWAGMAHSLEIRVPFVDVGFLKGVSPLTPSFTNGRGKQALAIAPSSPLPPKVRFRSKTGFSVPTGSWLAKVAGANIAQATKGAASREWAKHVFAAQDLAPDWSSSLTPEIV